MDLGSIIRHWHYTPIRSRELSGIHSTLSPMISGMIEFKEIRAIATPLETKHHKPYSAHELRHMAFALLAHSPRIPPTGASVHLRVDDARLRWLRVEGVLSVRLVVRFVGHQRLSGLRPPVTSEALHRCRFPGEGIRRWVAASARHRTAFASRQVEALASPERRQ